MCTCPNILPHLHGPCTGRMSEKSGCGLSVGIVQITDLDFVDDAVIMVETTEILCRITRVAERGSRAAWIACLLDQDQGQGVDILDATIESIPVSSEDVEVTQTFTYLGSVIHLSTSCELEVKRRLGRAWSAMNACGAVEVYD